MEEKTHFDYFTQVEEHYQHRRGSAGLLGALDWALIETWKDAGVPLEAVLRGIDATFDHYDARPSKTRKVNSLAYCTQEVLAAAEEMASAAEGSTRPAPQDSGFNAPDVAAFLARCADEIAAVKAPEAARAVVAETEKTLRELAAGLGATAGTSLEELERRLTVMEEKVFAALLAASADDVLVAIRAEADRELQPYRRKMPASEIERLQKHYQHKRLLERYRVPRLSLFYMG